MMSSSSPSDVRKEESTPSGLLSTTPTSGMPKHGRYSSSKHIRPRTAGPTGGGSRRGASRRNEDRKFINDGSKEQRSVKEKDKECKIKDEDKPNRSTSAQGRRHY